MVTQGNSNVGRLVVVSNRGPLRSQVSSGRRRWVRSPGGLVTALDPVLRDRGGLWVSAEEAEPEPGETTVEIPRLGYDLHAVRLGRAERNGFYAGVSNALLWPILHSMPPTIRPGEVPWGHYEKSNQVFANAVLEGTKPRDQVWIHDYHLMLVPRMVRNGLPARRRDHQRIGWFCHIPWPNPDLFEILPWRLTLLEGLLGADVIGFHTEGYVQNFLSCVKRLTPFEVRVRTKEIVLGDRVVKVIRCPIGVPVKEQAALGASAPVQIRSQQIRDRVSGRRILLGVDRLDYTKGIPERILGFERLLRKDRALRKKLVLIQLMVPSRTDVEAYAKLKQEIDGLIGSVNSRFSSTTQVAIHYLYANLDAPELFAHYLAADVALVTPLRDGMNLVAQEYVAAGMSLTNRKAALVLSELAGSADYLQGAWQVNPYDLDGIAAAMEAALGADNRETQRRLAQLGRAVEALGVHRWAQQFLSVLEAPA